MCGLAGFLSSSPLPDAAEAKATAARMAQALRHRGPDDRGAWTNAPAGIALAHARLSILDLSPEGHQPMHSGDGRYSIAFNGEIYNYAELMRDLASRGHQFRGHSDTEVMLAAFVEWGVAAAVERFNGMFAFAVWDGRERVLHLARDRMGEKPLYYGWFDSTFLFGSELKALRAHPAFDPSVSREATAALLRFSYVPAPHSIYSRVSKLMPGVLASVSTRAPGAVERRPYWSLHDAVVRARSQPLDGGPRDQVDALDDLLRRAVKIRMHADVPLGAFLSGGVDSSTVVALMQAQSERPVRTFTIGFRELGYDEAQDASRVARHLGTDHTELYVTARDALDVIPQLPEMYDEPFSDASQIPTYLVSKLARQHVTVSLSGDGGDELFGGYVRYAYGAQAWAWARHLPLVMRRAIGRLLGAVPPPLADGAYATISRVLPARYRMRTPADKLRKLATALSAETAEDMYRLLVSRWNDPARVVLGAHEPPVPVFDRAAAPPLESLPERMMFLDAISYLPDDVLVKLDRASMAVSLESRVPLLDHRVVELSWRLPLAAKIQDGVNKWILRQVLYRYVPRDLIERPKMGFSVPLDSWLRGPLRDWAEDLLSESRLRSDGLLDPVPVRALLREHQAGRRDHQHQLWIVLMLQAWLARQGGASRTRAA